MVGVTTGTEFMAGLIVEKQVGIDTKIDALPLTLGESNEMHAI